MEEHIITNNLVFNYVMNVVIGILMIIISTGIGYIITLIRGLMTTNTNFKLDIHSIIQEMKQIKEKMESLDKYKEKDRDELNSLKMQYLELKIKLDQLEQKHNL